MEAEVYCTCFTEGIRCKFCLFLRVARYHINLANSSWPSATHLSICFGKWHFIALSPRHWGWRWIWLSSFPPTPPRAPKSFPFFAASCWCGDRWCYSMSRGNPDRLFSICLGACLYNSATLFPLTKAFWGFWSWGRKLPSGLKEGRVGNRKFVFACFAVCIICLISFDNHISWVSRVSNYEPPFEDTEFESLSERMLVTWGWSTACPWHCGCVVGTVMASESFES